MPGSRGLDQLFEDVAQLARPVPAPIQEAPQGHRAALQSLVQRIISDENMPPTEQARPQLEKLLSSALVQAAGNGHPDALSAILEASASFLDPNVVVCTENEQGETALMLSATAGSIECIKRLLRYNPDAQVAAADRFGNTALMRAVSKGHVGCAWQLLQHGAEGQVQAAEKYGHTALMRAAAKGHASCLSLLLQHIPELQVAAADKFNDTALMMAVWTNQPDCVARLLAHSPAMQLAATNNVGRCAITAAAMAGRPRCLQLLLPHGQAQQLDHALLLAMPHAASLPCPGPHTQCVEQLLASGARLPAQAETAHRDTLYRIIQDLASRALVPERTAEAIVSLALTVRQRG